MKRCESRPPGGWLTELTFLNKYIILVLIAMSLEGEIPELTPEVVKGEGRAFLTEELSFGDIAKIASGLGGKLEATYQPDFPDKEYEVEEILNELYSPDGVSEQQDSGAENLTFKDVKIALPYGEIEFTNGGTMAPPSLRFEMPHPDAPSSEAVAIDLGQDSITVIGDSVVFVQPSEAPDHGIDISPEAKLRMLELTKDGCTFRSGVTLASLQKGMPALHSSVRAGLEARQRPKTSKQVEDPSALDDFWARNLPSGKQPIASRDD